MPPTSAPLTAPLAVRTSACPGATATPVACAIVASMLFRLASSWLAAIERM
jgi:hypothetical protein